METPCTSIDPNSFIPPVIGQAPSQAYTNLILDSDAHLYYPTADYEEAEDILEQKGRVVLCGPPGCGKTALAHALLRQGRDDGLTPYTLTQVRDWHTRVGEGKPCVVLMDGLFGKARVDWEQHQQWEGVRRVAQELTSSGHCRLVLTVYPHVLRQLQDLDAHTESPFVDGLCVVEVMQTPLDAPAKRSLLELHLADLQLQPEALEDVIDRVVRKDVSGRVFPWCCKQLRPQWRSLDDPTEVFTFPAEAHVSLLEQMVSGREDGDVFAAVLVLAMLGEGQFLLKPHRVQHQLLRLGMNPHCDDSLEKCAYYLKRSILAACGTGFAHRVLYDAAGLALGRRFRKSILLRICDARFLVRHLRSKETADVFSIPVGSEPEEEQLLVARVYEEVVRGRLPEMSQHPCLQDPSFLVKVETLCRDSDDFLHRLVRLRRPSLRRFLTAVDPTHGLPLLYWSVFSPSPTLARWCFTVMRDKNLLPACLPRVLLAWCLFRHWPAREVHTMVTSLSLFCPKRFVLPESSALLPLPAPAQRLTRETVRVVEVVSDYRSDGRRLCYLGKPLEPIADWAIDVLVEGEQIRVRVCEHQHWYLALRLLTDKEGGQVDRTGSTLIQQAFEYACPHVFAVTVRSLLLQRFPLRKLPVEQFLEVTSFFCFHQHPFFIFMRYVLKTWFKIFVWKGQAEDFFTSVKKLREDWNSDSEQSQEDLEESEDERCIDFEVREEMLVKGSCEIDAQEESGFQSVLRELTDIVAQSKE